MKKHTDTITTGLFFCHENTIKAKEKWIAKNSKLELQCRILCNKYGSVMRIWTTQWIKNWRSSWEWWILVEGLNTLLKYINYYKRHTKYVKTRADGSAWYERSIRNRKIAGSNPAQSIEHLSAGMLGNFCAHFYKIVDHQST